MKKENLNSFSEKKRLVRHSSLLVLYPFIKISIILIFYTHFSSYSSPNMPRQKTNIEQLFSLVSFFVCRHSTSIICACILCICKHRIKIFMYAFVYVRVSYTFGVCDYCKISITVKPILARGAAAN